jgi:hypothetical protein
MREKSHSEKSVHPHPLLTLKTVELNQGDQMFFGENVSQQILCKKKQITFL